MVKVAVDGLEVQWPHSHSLMAASVHLKALTPLEILTQALPSPEALFP